tara:strand:+ start:243 stop:659 length:417 start_codon:yes stop_codon:yes gene_type:complete
MKRQPKKNEFDLNSLSLFPELIKEIRSFLPKQWVLYKKGKHNLKKGDAVRMEKIEYGKLKSDNIYCVPPTRDCVGKILYLGEAYCEVRFLKQRKTRILSDSYLNRNCSYFLNKKYIRPANFSDKKKVTINKKNIITET